MRGSVRLAALSQYKVIYFWTHDSVGLGEDGPTHQPIEHLASLRAMPGLRVIRPADANETAHGLRLAIERDGPTALILSRQAIPVLGRHRRRGGQRRARAPTCCVDGGDDPDVVLIGTGSEVSVCVSAAELLAERGHRRPGGVHAQLGALRRAGRRLPGRGAGAGRRSCRWRRPPPSAGSSGPTTRWPSTTSARPARARRYWRTSASPPRTWPPGPGPCSTNSKSDRSTGRRRRRHEEDTSDPTARAVRRARARAPGSTT